MTHDTAEAQLRASALPDMRVDPIAMVLMWVASTDEFEQLRKAGRRLWQDLQGDAHSGPVVDDGEIDNWFVSTEHQAGGWIFYGAGDLTSRLAGLARTELKLVRLSPTHVGLLAEAHFAGDVKAEFGRVASAPLPEAVRLYRRVWVGGTTSWIVQPRSAEFLRRDLFEQLLSSPANRLIGLLNTRGAAGLRVAHLSVLGMWGKWLARPEAREFWRAVGISPQIAGWYSRATEANLFFQGYESHDNLLVVDVPDLSKDSAANGAMSDGSVAMHRLRDDITSIMRGLAAATEIDALDSDIAKARRQVMSSVRNRSWLARWVGWVPGRWLRALDRMQFDAVRLERPSWLEQQHGLEAYARAGIQLELGNPGILIEDWTTHLKTRLEYARGEIEVLRDAFAGRIDYGLQRVGLILTAVGVVIAVPDSWRTFLLECSLSAVARLVGAVGTSFR